MMTKEQVRKAVERFIADDGRVISHRLLCQIAGISIDTFKNVFINKVYDISPMVQKRMERALEALERGELKVTEREDRTRHAGYRKCPEMEYKRHYGLTVKDGKIALDIGPRNVNCYRQKSFGEKLWRS